MSRGLFLSLSSLMVALVLGVGFYWYDQQGQQAENPSNIVVSPYDDRVFHTLTLKNGLSVILVSDPDSDKAAAALNVHSGSWANPADAQGLAHFLEHMLFLGTEKYPAVDGYQTFIEQNGGRNNAYTAAENTLYYFDIAAQELEPALDRFSQFFIAPLFDPDFTDRERNAVQSEYSASLQNEARRQQDVVRELVNPEHPASQLAIGNLVTLNSPDLRSKLQTFFRTHYVSDNMSLSVYGPQSIDELTLMAERYFSAIRSVGQAPSTTVDTPLFDTNDLPMLVEIEPKRELRQLEIRFPIPATTTHMDTRPYRYIGHLLGHESNGSLLSLLKTRGLAENLYAGAADLTSSNTTFDVTIELTPAGLDAWPDVTELLFSHIEQLKRDGIQPWIYEERQRIQDIAFQFSEQVSAMQTAATLAERLQYYAPEQALSGPFQLAEFDPTVIASAFEALKPDNALVLLTHPDANTEQQSEYYSTPYSTESLTGNRVAAWRTPANVPELSIPEPNPFIPTDLSVKPLEREQSKLFNYHPQVISASETKTVWFEQDDEFRTPKSDIHMLLATEALQNSVDQYVAMALYRELVDDALNEVRFQASLAGSGYGLNLTSRGLQVRLYGYQDKLPLLLDTLVLELTDHQISTERFELLKADMLRRMRNADDDPVVNQVIRHLNEWMVSDSYTMAQQIDAVQKLTPETLLEVRQTVFESAHLKLLVHGNLTQDEARNLAERMDAVLPQGGTQPQQRQVAKLPTRPLLTRMSIEHSDSALLQYHQGSDASLRERALYTLLADVLSAPYFAELRTKEQLGYIVLARPYHIDGWPGMILYVQSPTTDPALLQLYSDRFLKRYANEISDMSDASFLAYKKGLINSLTEPDKNLFELSSRYWQNILDGNAHFNTRQRLADEVSKISLDGFRRFFENRILGDDARTFAFHQIGTQMQDDYSEHVSDVIGFYPIDGAKNWPDDVEWVTPTFNNLP